MRPRCVQKMVDARQDFDKLKPISQYRLARNKWNEISDNDTFSIFYLRAVRVARQVANSNLEFALKRSYMNVLRDTVLPDERIVFANLAFYHSKRSRDLVRSWELDFVKADWYTCQIVSDFYHKLPKRAWHKTKSA